MQRFLDAVAGQPIIAAVRDDAALTAAIDSSARVVFLLGGCILDLPAYIRRLQAADKLVFLHLDLCDGLGRDFAAVDYVACALHPDGVISTRAPLLKHAATHGLITLQRLFLMDSQGLENGVKLLKGNTPDLIELMPGLVPKAISRIKADLQVPIIAGGMITELNEVNTALHAGASAVSTSARKLWDTRGLR